MGDAVGCREFTRLPVAAYAGFREGIFLSVVNYCHTATTPFPPENDGEWREVISFEFLRDELATSSQRWRRSDRGKTVLLQSDGTPLENSRGDRRHSPLRHCKLSKNKRTVACLCMHCPAAVQVILISAQVLNLTPDPEALREDPNKT
ncbi:hypothetical protein F2P81_002363 [Scophthalmus maximus]|uniref:Uncharacterized protein n=1 Tax=Scophthalmus maximus TaxID=52904 RepID=A0A6A4TRI3_SCOMX|nr:hypothetical protein F2P81_002363 [Scophthalmus maximus]